MNPVDINKQWMSKGNIGCTFAALFAKNPLSVNWITVVNPDKLESPQEAMILSIQFPGKTQEQVLVWAFSNGFYCEEIGGECKGLRYKVGTNVSWVQYFGPDSHVKTRQAPIPELMLCVKLPAKYYAKVGFNGVLHLAHTSISHLSEKITDGLWKSSFRNTAKRLTHSPTIREAAKTTYIG